MYEVLSILLKYLEVCAHATWELQYSWEHGTQTAENAQRAGMQRPPGVRRGWNVRRERGIVNTIVNTSRWGAQYHNINT